MITAAVLALAVAGLPVLLNQCAASCEAQHEAAASTPSCHHASSTGARVGHVPVPCGHDHDGALVPAVKSAPVKLWVVEIGMPILVPAITVIAAPRITEARKSGD